MTQVLYEDEAGNKIIYDNDGKLCAVNNDNEVCRGEYLVELLDESRIPYMVVGENQILIGSNDMWGRGN